jgi:hypothetical protein
MKTTKQRVTLEPDLEMIAGTLDCRERLIMAEDLAPRARIYLR